jgi:ubiquinone/menaquinone biosynthesis C-methylase UbiE
MAHRLQKNFQELFKDRKYVSVKNFLYNYLLRKRAISKCLKGECPDLMLEVGSGISPLITDRNNIVYSDISFEAIHILKQNQAGGHHVVADGTRLPFKANTFSHAVCSEVLEHVPDDQQAISEIYRTLKSPQGRLILTVPHRNCYFSFDDRFVKHYRRYELRDIENRLRAAGFMPIRIQKILGPLEKITMLGVVFLFSTLTKGKATSHRGEKWLKAGPGDFMISLFKWMNQFYKGYVWLDAKIMPRSFSTVILIESSSSNKRIGSNDPIS